MKHSAKYTSFSSTFLYPYLARPQSAKNWARTEEIKISDKMFKIAILRERIVFKHFDLLHGPIHLISFAYGHYVVDEETWNGVLDL